MDGDKSRIYGVKKNLDYLSVKTFFDNRKQKIGYIQPINLTMYQDKNPELAIQRDEIEKKNIFELVNFENKKYKILDIGCGIGRWGFHLIDYIDKYLGFDYSKDFINLAIEKRNQLNLNKLEFQVLSATDFDENDLLIKPPFNFVIIAGLMAYLNDEDCKYLLSKIYDLIDYKGIIYIREPIAINERLTLINHYSEELNSNYNAIYRNIKEYYEIFDNLAHNSKFEMKYSNSLFPDELNNRKETKQHIFLLEKVNI